MLKEPTLNELKEERKRLEIDLLSSTGKNQYEVSKILENINSKGISRLNVKSPLTRMSPSSSAGSIKSRASSTLSLNQVAASTEPAARQQPTSTSRASIKGTSPSSSIRKQLVDAKTITSSSHMIQQSNRSSSLSKPKPMPRTDLNETAAKKTLPVTTSAALNSTGSSGSDFKYPPVLTRNNSIISNTSSVGSSTSSNYSSPASSSKQTAAQKFRQMVLKNRD